MIDLLADLQRWRAEGVEAGRAVVVRTLGSAPRPEGAVLVAASDGRIAGSVSAGCVEGAVIEEIGRARRSGRSCVIRYGIRDERAWDVGLACGGTIDVLVEPSVRAELIQAAQERGRVVVTPLPDGLAQAPADAATVHGPPSEVVARALAAGRSLTVDVEERAYFLEVFPRRPRLLVVGGVEVARPLVSLAGALGYETIVADGRAVFATRERFPDADRIIAAWPDEAAEIVGLGADDAVAVLTHDPKFDEPAITVALARDCRYVGAIGSARAQAARRERLLAAGVPAAALQRLRGPIGLDLGGREPAETALAILAEIVAIRNGASGGPLRDRQLVGKADGVR